MWSHLVIKSVLFFYRKITNTTWNFSKFLLEISHNFSLISWKSTGNPFLKICRHPEWVHCNEYIAMSTLRWVHCNVNIATRTLQWLHTAMRTLRWEHCDENIAMRTLRWKCCGLHLEESSTVPHQGQRPSVPCQARVGLAVCPMYEVPPLLNLKCKSNFSVFVRTHENIYMLIERLWSFDAALIERVRGRVKDELARSLASAEVLDGLPSNTKSLGSIRTFKKDLITFLFELEYVSAWRNSYAISTILYLILSYILYLVPENNNTTSQNVRNCFVCRWWEKSHTAIKSGTSYLFIYI